MEKGQSSMGKDETQLPAEKGEEKWLCFKNQPGGLK